MKCRAPACAYLTKGPSLCPEHQEVWRQLLAEWTAELDTIIQREQADE